MSIILSLLISILKPGDHPDDGRRCAAFALSYSLTSPSCLERRERKGKEKKRKRKKIKKKKKKQENKNKKRTKKLDDHAPNTNCRPSHCQCHIWRNSGANGANNERRRWIPCRERTFRFMRIARASHHFRNSERTLQQTVCTGH